eukprot:15471082-Alexandrium_andersonii.AAC.1
MLVPPAEQPPPRPGAGESGRPTSSSAVRQRRLTSRGASAGRIFEYGGAPTFADSEAPRGRSGPPRAG